MENLNHQLEWATSGERQVAPRITEIRPDHVSRYHMVQIELKEKDRVVDFACGVGYGSWLMAQKCEYVLGLDRDVKAIRYAHQHYHHPRAEFKVGELPPQGEFHVATAFEILEHVNEPRRLIKNLIWAASDKARFYFSVPNEETQPFKKRMFPFHVRHFTPQDFASLLEGCGLKITRRYTQMNKRNTILSDGWGGLFNIAVCERV